MSLNFVSTSVLSSTDGVSHNTETRLQETSSSSQTTYQRPLYEQLRENAEKEQEKYDEVTKAMRGTTTLDEDDVAFIQSLEDRKAEIHNKVKKKEEEEVQMFRAARLEKTMMKSEVVVDDHGEEEEDNGNKSITSNSQTREETSTKASSSLINMKPRIIKKRRRKILTGDGKASESEIDGNLQKKKKDANDKDKYVKVDEKSKASDLGEDAVNTGTALGGLLAYGSDSESD